MTTVAAADRPRRPTSAAHSSGERKYRPELQGLRALAALLVVAYHIWFGRVSGGVDVFFLISGFLITGQLFRACQRGGIKFRAMWARMIKRLFPAALTVLVTIVAASILILPQDRWFQTIKEVVASALYVENWRLVADSVDYFAQHDSASVVQHYWSLSIQGQFYLVWPLLIAVAALVVRKLGWPLRPSLLGVLLTLFSASLIYSVWLTEADQRLAYFHSLTRVWEFALGGLLALFINWITLPRLLRIPLGWLGVIGLISCGFVLQVGTQFPGYYALWPTLSAAFVIVAGATNCRLGADRLLSTRPFEYVGNLSYALYLWHWPVLLFYLHVRQQNDADALDGIGLMAGCLLVAGLTYHLIEQPVRQSNIGVHKPWGAYRFGVLALTAVLAVAGAWQAAGVYLANQYTVAMDDPDHPGAAAMATDFEYQGAANAALAPPLVALPEDWATMEGQSCTASPRGAELEVCTTQPPEPPTRRIVVAGASHAQQYLGALLPIAQQRNWQIISMGRGGCPFSTDSDAVPGDQPCIDWNAAAADEIVALQPDAVFTMASRDVGVDSTERTPTGYVGQWRKLDAADIPVLAVRDNPRFDYSPSTCVDSNGPDSAQCATLRAQLFAPRPPYAETPDAPSNVSFLDFSDQICDAEFCRPVVGNVRVYLDDNHVSATYMATMSSVVEESIDAALDTDDPPVEQP